MDWIKFIGLLMIPYTNSNGVTMPSNKPWLGNSKYFINIRIFPFGCSTRMNIHKGDTIIPLSSDDVIWK
jgi:hypothetical protein